MSELLTDREMTLAKFIASRFDELPNDARALNAVIAQAAGVLTLDKDGMPQEVTEVEKEFVDRVSRAAKVQGYDRAELGIALLALAITKAKQAAGEAQ